MTENEIERLNKQSKRSFVTNVIGALVGAFMIGYYATGAGMYSERIRFLNYIKRS